MCSSDLGTVSGKIAKTVFEEMYNRSKTGLKIEVSSDVIVKEMGLVQISDGDTIEKTVEEVLANNANEVERFKAGDTKLIGFFVGQIMKLTKGKANPKIVNDLLMKKLR